MLYKIIDAYVKRFSFPHRGLKYFLRLLRLLGIAGKVYVKKMPEGFFMRLMPAEHIQRQLFWYGYYEKPLGDVLKKIIRPGDVFLDVGANTGYFSLLAARREPQSTIVAFEPVSFLFDELNRNIALNNFSNIKAIHAAAGAADELRTLFISGADNRGMSSFQPPDNYSGMKEEVKTLPLDNWVAKSGLAKVDIIKIDVEGSEVSVLQGMQQLLQKFKPVIIIEINPETLGLFHSGPADVLKFAADFSYRSFWIAESGKLEPLQPGNTDITVNALFIHPEKINLVQQLL
jgi:FkbM family methyltransferase